jgi:hypothetical protein
MWSAQLTSLLLLQSQLARSSFRVAIRCSLERRELRKPSEFQGVSQSILQGALPDPNYCIRHAVVAGFASESFLRQILPHGGGREHILKSRNSERADSTAIFVEDQS